MNRSNMYVCMYGNVFQHDKRRKQRHSVYDVIIECWSYYTRWKYIRCYAFFFFVSILNEIVLKQQSWVYIFVKVEWNYYKKSNFFVSVWNPIFGNIWMQVRRSWHFIMRSKRLQFVPEYETDSTLVYFLWNNFWK